MDINFLASNLATVVQKGKLEQEAKRKELDEIAKQKAKAWLERNTPLPARLAKFIESLPEAVRYSGLSMELFKDNLSGKYQGRVAAPEVGVALRSLGWVRVRVWHGESIGHISVWYPRDAPEAQPKSLGGRYARMLR